MAPQISFALVVAIAFSPACSKTDPTAERCQRGISHVEKLVTAATSSKGKGPSADEQRAIDAALELSTATCRNEGLSEEQLDCIIAATDMDTFNRLGDCPAIKRHRPGWLILP